MILIQLETHSEKSEIGTLTPILLHNKSYVSKKKITILEENTCGNYTFMRIEKEWGLGQSYTIRHFHR